MNAYEVATITSRLAVAWHSHRLGLRLTKERGLTQDVSMINPQTDYRPPGFYRTPNPISLQLCGH